MEALKITVIFVSCLIAVLTDLKFRKIYNWLTFPVMALGLIVNAAAYGFPGLGYGALGLLCGGLIFFPFFWLGGMGAGDVKLLAAVGSVMGAMMIVNVALYAALAGGFMALVVLVFKGRLWATLKATGRLLRSLMLPALAVEPATTATPFPYALAIAAGVLAVLFLPPLIRF